MIRRSGFPAVLSLASCLGACDYGPAVDGGQPAIAHEVTGYSNGRSSTGGTTLARTHYFEVSPRNLEHPRELEAFFRWRCRETYLPWTCTIDAWPPGAAPRHSRLLDEDKETMVAAYYLNRATNEESFTLRPPGGWWQGP